jgi:hypothetical protein
LPLSSVTLDDPEPLRIGVFPELDKAPVPKGLLGGSPFQTFDQKFSIH